jgi:hypothetical protein
MIGGVGMRFLGPRAAILLAVASLLAGCGSDIRASPSPGTSLLSGDPSTHSTRAACAATVLETLREVAMRVYHEGVASERTGSAEYLITNSTPLRRAVEEGDAAAAHTAAQALLQTGHMTNLLITRDGKLLTDVGASPALAPLSGTLTGSAGVSIGSYQASVWTDAGLSDEIDGTAEGSTVLRENGHTLFGTFKLPHGPLPAQGTLTRKDVAYAYTSFDAEAYPSGSPLQVYLFRSVHSVRPLCGPTSQDTVVSTLSHVASLIYDAETGPLTLPQVHRVQRDPVLLQAVSRREPVATRAAIVSLLNHHIVRLRVLVDGRVLSDVGGPDVLAPVRAPLQLQGHTIGTIVLSIQDDEGYLRLARRLAGLDVVMYRGGRLVMDNLGHPPGAVPLRGALDYEGRTFRAFTFTAEAFPSGPLRITVLIPIPYL